jgi:hypothetical protein
VRLEVDLNEVDLHVSLEKRDVVGEAAGAGGIVS